MFLSDLFGIWRHDILELACKVVYPIVFGGAANPRLPLVTLVTLEDKRGMLSYMTEPDRRDMRFILGC